MFRVPSSSQAAYSTFASTSAEVLPERVTFRLLISLPVSIFGASPAFDAVCVRRGLYFSYVSPMDGVRIRLMALVRTFCAVLLTNRPASCSNLLDSSDSVLLSSSSPSMRKLVMLAPLVLLVAQATACAPRCPQRRVSDRLGPCTKCDALALVWGYSAYKLCGLHLRLASSLATARTCLRASSGCAPASLLPTAQLVRPWHLEQTDTLVSQSVCVASQRTIRSIS